MALAIATSLKSIFDILVLGRNETKLEYIQKKHSINTQLLTPNYNIDNANVLLAIKPYALDFLSNFKGKAKNVFSVLASVDIDTLKNHIKSSSYTRAMPNMSAMYGSSITSLYSDNIHSNDVYDKDFINKIFTSIGDVVWLEKEEHINTATAIASSSLAFISMIAEALEDGGVIEGLSREKSKSLVYGLFKGFAPILKDNNPSTIKDMVMSPKGMTAKGYAVLEKRAIRGAIIEAVSKSSKIL